MVCDTHVLGAWRSAGLNGGREGRRTKWARNRPTQRSGGLNVEDEDSFATNAAEVERVRRAGIQAWRMRIRDAANGLRPYRHSIETADCTSLRCLRNSRQCSQQYRRQESPLGMTLQPPHISPHDCGNEATARNRTSGQRIPLPWPLLWPLPRHKTQILKLRTARDNLPLEDEGATRFWTPISFATVAI